MKILFIYYWVENGDKERAKQEKNIRRNSRLNIVR